MIKISHVKELSKITHLPNEVCTIAETAINFFDNEFGVKRSTDPSDGGFVVVLEQKDSLNALDEVGLNSDVLFPDFVEIIQVEEATYSCSMLLNTNSLYVSLIMPLSLTPPDFLNSFHANVKHSDLACEYTDFSEEYHNLEAELTASYTGEQMTLFVKLEALKENYIFNLKETFYNKGFKDGVHAVYRKGVTCNEH